MGFNIWLWLWNFGRVAGVIAWSQLGIHDKPVGLLNVDGYYNYLLTFIDKAIDDDFIEPSQHHIIISAQNAMDLVEKLEEYVPVHDGAIAVSIEGSYIWFNATIEDGCKLRHAIVCDGVIMKSGAVLEPGAKACGLHNKGLGHGD